jgi:hypothetical protein
VDKGFDAQLGEDVDQPQANYFVSLARCMRLPAFLAAVLVGRHDSPPANLVGG